MQMYRVLYYSCRKAPIAITFVKKIKFNSTNNHPSEKFLISLYQTELVEIFTQSGKSIDRMEQDAKKLCVFLSRAYGFRVEELVLDFIRDKYDRYWVMNVVSFVLESSNYYVKKLEHEKLISNQAAALGLLREQATDSSNY